MNHARGAPSSRKCYTSFGRQVTLACPTSRVVTITHASLSAAKQSGSSELGKRTHTSADFDSSKARVGVCDITFQTASGTHVVETQKGANVYNAADYAGLRLPASCKQGSCSSCVGKVLDGRVTHSRDPQCLTPSLKAQGYIALCCATVVGDATILTHQGTPHPHLWQWSVPRMWMDAPPYLLYAQGAKLRAARALQLDRMRHRHG